jgi:hypothetical protein
MNLYRQTNKRSFPSPKLDIKYETSTSNEQPPCTLCTIVGDGSEQGFAVTRYPRKPRKNPAKESQYTACILSRRNLETSHREFLLCRFGGEATSRKRRFENSEKSNSIPTGLASLWQIPQEEWLHTNEAACGSKAFERIGEFLRTHFKLSPKESLAPTHLGTLTHKLSHIHQIFDVWHLDCGSRSMKPLMDVFSYRWVGENELRSDQRSLAISTGSLKMLMLLDNFGSLQNGHHSKKTRSTKLEANHRLPDYFTLSRMKKEEDCI